MKDKELKAFLIVLRQALLLVVSYIEKHYMNDKGGTHTAGPNTTTTPVMPVLRKDYSMRVR